MTYKVIFLGYMKVLVSGGSGFLGNYIKKEIVKIGWNYTTIGIDESDMLKYNFIKEIPSLCEDYDYVIHAAGKAHLVPRTEEERKSFFDINVEGTKNFLNGLEKCQKLPKTLLFISSVAVYGLETGSNINEDYTKDAKDPYGQTKILAENLIIDWGKAKNVKICIVRPPLLIGKPAVGNLKSMIDGIMHFKYANIAGGKARRSMILAEDLVAFIPKLLEVGGIYNLTDGHHPSFNEISRKIGNQVGKNILNIPFFVAKLLALLGDFISYCRDRQFAFNSRQLSKMTNDLTFDDSKARKIGWKPKLVLDEIDSWM